MARTQLAGKYGIFIGAYVLYLVISNIVSMIISKATGFSLDLSPVLSGSAPTVPFRNTPQLVLYLVFNLLFGLLMAILSLGFNKMFLDGSRGYPVRFPDLFYGFRHHPDRILLMQLVLEGISILCCLPGCILIFYTASADGELTLMFAGLILLLAGLILSLYFTLTFSQAPYLMADYDDIGPIQALLESKHMMKGNKGRLFYITLSFIGLYLLNTLTCGLAMLWIFPYENMTMTNFYRNLGNEI